MRALGVLLLAAVSVSACSNGLEAGVEPPSSQAESLIDALELHPAGLRSSPDSLVVGDGLPDGCGDGFRSSLLVVDPTDGSLRWEVATPWGSDGPVVLGEDTVVVVGQQIDDAPPSVAAMSLRSGEIRWQRFLDGSRAELLASDGDRVAVGVDDRFLLLDEDGAIVGEFGLALRRSVSSDGQAPYQPTWAAQRSGHLFDPFSDPPGPLPLDGAVFDESGPVITGDVAIFVGDTTVGLVESDPSRSWVSGSLPLDEEFSRVDGVRLGDDEVLVLVGSELGPNRRLVVLGLEDGAVRWVLDGVREAAAPYGRVLYDVRNTTPDGDGPTRDVFAVADGDPSEVLWSLPSTGTLGGYVGSTAGADVFLTQPPSIWPRGPYPETGSTSEVQHFPAELTFVSGPEQGLEALTDPTRDRLKPGRSIVTDDWVAAIGTGGVTLRTSRGDELLIAGSERAQILIRHHGLLLIGEGRPNIMCD